MKNHNLILREAAIADAEQLTRLDELCFAEQIQYDKFAFLYLVSQPDTLGLIIEHKNELIAFIILITDEKSKSANITTLDVHLEFRRQGIATKLIEAAEMQLRKSGCHSITLQVGMRNEAAISFYQSQGYEIQDQIGNYYPNEDAYLMVKELM